VHLRQCSGQLAISTILNSAGRVLSTFPVLSINDRAWPISVAVLLQIAAKAKGAVTDSQTVAEHCSMKCALSSSACAGSRRLGAVRNGAISNHCCIGLAFRCPSRQPPHRPPPLPTYLQPTAARRATFSTAPAHGHRSGCQAAVLHDHSYNSRFWCWRWHQHCP